MDLLDPNTPAGRSYRFLELLRVYTERSATALEENVLTKWGEATVEPVFEPDVLLDEIRLVQIAMERLRSNVLKAQLGYAIEVHQSS